MNKGQKEAWLCRNIVGGFAYGGEGEALEDALGLALGGVLGLALGGVLGLAVVAAPPLGTAVSPVVSRSLCSSCPPVGSGTVEGLVLSSASGVDSVVGAVGTAGA